MTRIDAPWSKNAAEVLDALATSERGLQPADARGRVRENGANDIAAEANVPWWKIFFQQFTSPLVLILIGASVIAIALGEQTETVIILVMVFLGGVLAFVQEYRSERALRSLRKKLTRRATVIRNGKAQRIDARELVIGDIVELELGSVVAADLRLFRVEDIELDESMLTGESVPVAKSIAEVGGLRLPPQEQTNMAFMGTHVVQGSALGVVTAAGSATEMGSTAALLAVKTDETEFQRGIRGFGNFLLKVTIGMAIAVTVVLGLIHGNWSEALLFALALAVGVSPELLPVIVTINLSRGALLMSKKKVLVKRLVSIEDLGNADVFCTDKTGTLTIGKPRVRGAIDPNGDETTYPLALGAHCVNFGRNGRATNPIDEAIAEAIRHEKLALAYPDAEIKDVVSFDFTRRRMSCVMDAKGGRRLIVKGAVKEVLAQCVTRRDGSASAPLTAADRRRIEETADEHSSRGVRLIAVAEREIGEQRAYSPRDERDLELVGFIRISDAPKETAKAALEALDALHVRIMILTGDHAKVTAFVASELGFHVTGTHTGEEVEAMNDAALEAAVENANVFAEITPEHKLRIIRALKKRGHTVGCMGDGVNDAPALRAADVGISFEDAIDVAKEAASVILLKKNLSVLADGIREGRKTFVNTRTYLNATISSNFGNMLSVAGASLVLPFIPLLPAQILLLNLLSDAPMLAISADRVSDEDVAYPKRWNIREISNFMYFFGIISSLADYATFGLLLFVVHADVTLFRSGWFIESLLTEIVVIFLLRTKRLSFANRPGGALVAAAVATVVLSFVVVQSSFGRAAELVPVGMKTLGAIALIVLGYAILTELGKVAYDRFHNRAEP